MESQVANVDTAQLSRRRLASSTAFGLVEVQAPDEEIRAALSQADRQDIPVAIYAVLEELRPANEDEEVEIAGLLGRQIGLLRMGAPIEQKEEWIALASDELREFPADRVIKALNEGRGVIRFEGEVVPYVREQVEPKVAKLRRELEKLQELARIAG